MTLLDVMAIGFQIILPVGLILWLALRPLRNRVGFTLQIIATGMVLLYLALVPVWLIPPWWTPYIYMLLGAVVLIRRVRIKSSIKHRLPGTVGGWVATVMFIILGGYAAIAVGHSLSGRNIPQDVTPVDLAFPLGPGIYLVANGGSHAVVNAHFLTLNPQTERQAAYRGQSYAVDFIKIDRWGLRAPGWRPRDPAAYAIFGEPVFAPCDGRVIDSSDGQADMAVPEMDQSRIEGNHVVLQCGNIAVFMGHLRQSSVAVAPGDFVSQGDPVGEVGNTGQTGEPHLHIHAQYLPQSRPLLSGDPLYLTLDGLFPVRNQRIVIETPPAMR